MGGRGSGSGGGGSAVNAKMPELSGSEKQVSWANDIRESCLRNADNMVRYAENSLASGTDRYNPTAKSTKEARSDVIRVLQNVTSASQIINARDSLSYDSLKKMASEIDRKKNRGYWKKQG